MGFFFGICLLLAALVTGILFVRWARRQLEVTITIRAKPADVVVRAVTGVDLALDDDSDFSVLVDARGNHKTLRRRHRPKRTHLRDDVPEYRS